MSLRPQGSVEVLLVHEGVTSEGLPACEYSIHLELGEVVGPPKYRERMDE